MNYHNLADAIIVWTAAYFLARGVVQFVLLVADAIITKVKRVKWNRLNRQWVAARVAAREETTARLKAEGRWDNYEIQDAMDAAGEAVWPGGWKKNSYPKHRV